MMATRTHLNLTDLESILKTNYKLGNILNYKVLGGGSENTNYWIKVEDKEVLLTVSEQKSLEQATELALLLEYLEKNSFDTSKIIKTITGELVTISNGKPIIVKEFIQGNVIEYLPDNILKYIGEELSKLHQIKAPDSLSRELNYGIEHFDTVKLYAPESDFYKWLKDMALIIKKSLKTELPFVLNHSDIFYDNIIVSKDQKKATIMDFEEACNYYRVYDIGMMIIGTCTEGEKVNLTKASYILKGYQKHIQLLQTEKEVLQMFTAYAATNTAFWRHKNFNYVSPEPNKKDHYLQMKNLADSVMQITKEEFKAITN
jgi:homoserine kinase type II